MLSGVGGIRRGESAQRNHTRRVRLGCVQFVENQCSTTVIYQLNSHGSFYITVFCYTWHYREKWTDLPGWASDKEAPLVATNTETQINVKTSMIDFGLCQKKKIKLTLASKKNTFTRKNSCIRIQSWSILTPFQWMRLVQGFTTGHRGELYTVLAFFVEISISGTGCLSSLVQLNWLNFTGSVVVIHFISMQICRNYEDRRDAQTDYCYILSVHL